MVDIPKFNGTGMALAREVSEWVNAQLSPTQMTVVGLLRLGSRTPMQVLERGKFAPILGCYDKSIIIASIMKDHGYDSRIILQQVLSEGKPISCHFAVDAKRDAERIGIDPHPFRTDFYPNGVPENVPGKMTSPFEGKQEVVYRKVKEHQVNGNHWNTPGYKLAGLRTGLGVLTAAGVPKVTFAKFAWGRIKGPKNKSVKKGSLSERAARVAQRKK
ncbi:MAG: hypothetical protein WC746_05580 [archaeon]|jgi:hypothetical protein